MGMWSYATLAFAVTAVLTLALRPLAFRLHLTDKPGGRKRHFGEIPVVGGIAMLIGILVTAIVALKPATRALSWFRPRCSSAWACLTTATIPRPRHGLRHRSAPRS